MPDLNIGQYVIVGRLGTQALKIEDMTVSRSHCKIKRVGTDAYQIEDLGSSRGTIVNGLPIYQATVKADTPLLLGNFKTTVGQLLGISVAPHIQTSQPQPANPQPQQKIVHIGHLERIYDKYEQAQKDISKQRVRDQSRRAMPMQIGLPLIMGAGMFLDLLISDASSANTIKGVLSAGCIGLSVILSLRAISSGDSIIDDQFEINKQFQIDYVCPQCKNFLGMGRPVQALLNTGQCPYCKSIFKR